MLTVFKPAFYRFGSDSDLESLDEILANPEVKVCDEMHGQLTELMKLRHPEKRFTKEQLDQEVITYLNGRDEKQYGVWVFYPWSCRLVHLLDKDEFIEVRTSRNQYKITPEERDLLATKKVGVIGLSVGQSVSVTMAMERICGELRLADFDRLELTNLNRIRTGVHNLGVLKVHSVAREIAELDPFINVVCFPEGLTEENMDAFFTGGGKLDLVVEESDGFDIKVLCRYKARELKVPVIMEASDRCMVDVERFDLEPDRKILHGILDHLSVEKMKTLTTNEEKIPYMFDILGLDSTSAKLRASMLEMQQTITTWPQLASAVTMGGGITADVSRRMLLNDFKGSGRYYVDIDELIGDKAKAADTSVKARDQRAFRPAEIFNRINKLDGGQISREDLTAIVDAACSAPSFANAQPWIWLNTGFSLVLCCADSDVHSEGDYKDLHRNVFFGAAIENARQKAASLGYTTQVRHDFNDAEIVATLGFKKSAVSENLAGYINAPVAPASTVSLDFLKHFEKERNDGIVINITVNAAEIRDLASALASAEKIRLIHPVLNKEYFTHDLKFHASAGDLTGSRTSQLNYPAAVITSLKVLSDPPVAATLRKWNKGTAFRNFFLQLFSQSLAFGVLRANGSDRDALLRAGMTAQRLSLQCKAAGLVFQPICVSLSLLKHLSDNTAFSDSLNAVEKTELLNLAEKMDKVFGKGSVNESVLLFRLEKGSTQNAVPLRKNLSDIFFSSKQASV